MNLRQRGGGLGGANVLHVFPLGEAVILNAFIFIKYHPPKINKCSLTLLLSKYCICILELAFKAWDLYVILCLSQIYRVS